MDPQLDGAFDDLVGAVAASAGWLRRHPFAAEPENQPAAYSFLVGMLLARIEEEVVFGPDLPYFRVLDQRIREGGDNPDQRYLISRINGGDTYRIWGRLGACRRLDVQIYAGNPYVAGSGGRAASFLAFEQLDADADGRFEVIASAEHSPGNWIENPEDATRVLVRQIYGEWTDEPPGEVHIDRLGHEGDPAPVLTAGEMAARLRAAADSLRTHVRAWPEMVERNYLTTLAPNELSPPFDPGSVGGVTGRWMCHGTFELDPGDALVITTRPAGGNYQGIQLADLWFSSLEYANRQTSLTADQSHRSEDGTYRFVVSARDPGVPNWLDTLGRRRGVILLRVDGTGADALDRTQWPTASLVRWTDLGAHLPVGTPRVGPDQRRRAIAARRRHVQVRFGI